MTAPVVPTAVARASDTSPPAASTRPDSGPGDDFAWAALVPELTCFDLAKSVFFYTDTLGARIAFDRPGFCYLVMGRAQLMLEQASPDGWITAPLEPPLGRGVNFQIEVDNVDAVTDRLSIAGVPLFMPLEENWYRAGDVEHGQRECLVQDPDGYLLRLVTVLGSRDVRSSE